MSKNTGKYKPPTPAEARAERLTKEYMQHTFSVGIVRAARAWSNMEIVDSDFGELYNHVIANPFTRDD